jgi:hypothetical protein
MIAPKMVDQTLELGCVENFERCGHGLGSLGAPVSSRVAELWKRDGVRRRAIQSAST